MSEVLPPPADAGVRQHSSHWGAFNAHVEDGRLVRVEPFAADPSPSAISAAIPHAVYADTRVAEPCVRRSWLDHGPGTHTESRGVEAFVRVSWDEALDLVASELRRVRGEHGNDAIFGGSYGWSSAGRFHHAKTLLQRFLGQFGGYVDQIHTYSNAAGHAILPYIFGEKGLGRGPFTSWDSVCGHTDLFVAFGGLGLKNTQVEPGGMGEHSAHKWLPRLRESGVQVVSITPVRDDTAQALDAEWLSPRPNTDVALMLGIAHTLLSEALHDVAFLRTHTEGFEHFARYLMGHDDGVTKDVVWASGITELEPQVIVNLARRMAGGRTMIGVAYALQRAEHGEQCYWMAATLAAMLGQIGLPGGGCGFGYGSMNGYGNPVQRFPVPVMLRGPNPSNAFIPVARIADMLLHPGEQYQFDGQTRTYPDVKLVYWCGGNPFHHHQDLNRLVRAWQRLQTVVVNEIWWTATAKHADIVLPATTTLERNDIGASSRDRFIVAMQKAIAPVGLARSDYDTFTGLAARLGLHERFTEGRDEAQWLRHLYDVSRQQAARQAIELPDFDEFWRLGHVEVPAPEAPYVAFDAFRRDPKTNPLKTPSGKVEIYSARIGGYGYYDCPGHPMWLEPKEWLGGPLASRFALHMISNQPATKLHGQMDDGPVSRAGKRNGREPIEMHPEDAKARGIEDGQVVRVFNARGALLACASLSQGIRRGVVRVATGAWYDPAQPGQVGTLEKHGNPNVLTRDVGTSQLAQGPVAHSALVEVERYLDEPPPLSAHAVPRVEDRVPVE